MNDRIKLPLTFDVNLMQKDLVCFHADDWIEHFVKQNYEGDWSVIPLRGPVDATHPVMMIYSDPTCTEFGDTVFLKQTRYFPKVLAAFQCPLQAVRLMKLSAGSRIKEHTDFDLAVENGVARLHIPVLSDGKVDFLLNSTRVEFREGECWYLRLCDPHSVENHGSRDRVHLVIDACVNDWLKRMLQG